MAIGQARNEFVQRSQGQNICHKAAYIDRAQLEFEGTRFQSGRTYDYSSREAPLAKKIMLPGGVDEKFLNPEILWNAAEKIEKQHNSQVGMELVIALPDDKVITEEDRTVLTERFAQQFVDKGLAAHYAIHRPDEKEDHNWHTHILVPTRTFSNDGQDLNHLKDRSLQKEISNTRWGEVWTKMQNDYFKELGLDLRVDPKSLNPQEHLGAVRLRGNCLDMLERHEEIQKQNAIDASDPSKILKAISDGMAVWQVQDVERFMAKHTPPEKLEEVRDLFWKQTDIVNLQEKDLKSSYSRYKDIGKFTTKEVIEEEKQILRRCEKINDVEHLKVREKHLEKFSRNLSPEQLQAFRELSGREGLYVLEGYAGTGKSYVLEALKESYEARGVTVQGFGPDNATANLLKEKGFNAENVPRFLYAQEHGHREIKAYGREFKANIQEVMQYQKENKHDKLDSHDFYSRNSIGETESQEYGVSKLKDIAVHGIENQSMKTIEKDLERQAELQRIEEGILQRQEMQLEKLAGYQDHCQSEGLEAINNIESIFSPENERSIVVLCASQSEAEEASKKCKQEGFVFLSLEREYRGFASEKEVNLSALEDRKLLACGSEMERQELSEKLKTHGNMFARETSWEFSAEHSRDFKMVFDSEDIKGTGTWWDVEKQEKEIDVQLGIEEEQQNQRGFELSL